MKLKPHSYASLKRERKIIRIRKGENEMKRFRGGSKEGEKVC
jgi:hypothetical protein